MKAGSKMIIFLCVCVSAGLLFSASATNAQPRHIVVERPLPDDSVKAPFRYEAGNDSVAPRLVIDAGEMIYQMRVDSINKSAEAKIKKLIEKLERHFEDPKVEEEVGKLIGEAILEQQMAMLDIQVERALSMRDSLLLKGLELALREILRANPGLQDQILKQIESVERELIQMTKRQE